VTVHGRRYRFKSRDANFLIFKNLSLILGNFLKSGFVIQFFLKNQGLQFYPSHPSNGGPAVWINMHFCGRNGGVLVILAF